MPGGSLPDARGIILHAMENVSEKISNNLDEFPRQRCKQVLKPEDKDLIESLLHYYDEQISAGSLMSLVTIGEPQQVTL